MIEHVALTSETNAVSFAELAQVAAACQKQVLRDFARHWGIQATVDAFARLEDVPVGYWRVIVADNINGNRIGFHRTRDGQPYAMVLYREEDWTTTTSHEILEMLANPSGDEVVAGQSLDHAQGRVEFLREVCDPCADPDLGYRVNGIRLSDFYTPQYHDPVQAPGVSYSFTGSITQPRGLAPGGYLSWRVPTTGEWFLATRNGTVQIQQVQAPITGGSLREWIDGYTRQLTRPRARSRRTRRLKADRAHREQTALAMAARAAQLRQQIAAL